MMENPLLGELKNTISHGNSSNGLAKISLFRWKKSLLYNKYRTTSNRSKNFYRRISNCWIYAYNKRSLFIL